MRPWLESYTWEIVTTLNRGLCEAKNALHKPTSDGHDATRALWDSSHLSAMTLAEADLVPALPPDGSLLLLQRQHLCIHHRPGGQAA